MTCIISNCKQDGLFLNSWRPSTGRGKNLSYARRIFGLMCKRHDRHFGLKNLVESGMTEKVAHDVEKELEVTNN